MLNDVWLLLLVFMSRFEKFKSGEVSIDETEDDIYACMNDDANYLVPTNYLTLSQASSLRYLLQC